MSSAPLLEVENVSQHYWSGPREFVALQNINLRIEETEFVALLGPSGCGKSTLLRIITGLTPPTHGRVLYRGSPLRGINPRATIVFQTFALFPWLTVQQNVEVAIRVRNVPENVATTRALDLLDKVGLDGFETAYPRELSGGMRQKVGFARAMAVNPELLCMDEPFSALDVLSAEALRGELIDMWTGGVIPTKAILMVTHNIEEAAFMADRVVVMEKDPGRVVADIRVSLARPRLRKHASFMDMVDRIYATMAGQTQPEHLELGVAPGEEGRLRALPNINLNDLFGLLEQVHQLPGGRADLFRLAEALQLDSDHLLRLTETAELLGFATVAYGDIALTPLGEAFAESSLLARKEIFAGRIRRVPIFRWLLNQLEHAERNQMRWAAVKELLEQEFPSEEAERQLDISVNWGRYAEIIAYDDSREVLYLEPVGTK
jgi:NitT/TauT family transport system ATP-binding protein